MARYTFEGIDAILADAQREDKTLRSRITRALRLAGDAAVPHLQKQTEKFKRPTGELATKVAPGEPQNYAERSFIEVWAQGTYTGRSRKPRRAEEVAFVLEYGRGGTKPMRPNPWQKRSMKKAEKTINAIMEEILG